MDDLMAQRRLFVHRTGDFVIVGKCRMRVRGADDELLAELVAVGVAAVDFEIRIVRVILADDLVFSAQNGQFHVASSLFMA